MQWNSVVLKHHPSKQSLHQNHQNEVNFPHDTLSVRSLLRKTIFKFSIFFCSRVLHTRIEVVKSWTKSKEQFYLLGKKSKFQTSNIGWLGVRGCYDVSREGTSAKQIKSRGGGEKLWIIASRHLWTASDGKSIFHRFPRRWNILRNREEKQFEISIIRLCFLDRLGTNVYIYWWYALGCFHFAVRTNETIQCFIRQNFTDSSKYH